MDCTQQLGNYVSDVRPVDEIGYLGILGEVHAIKMGPNKIGRDASFCDITIDKPSLSRQHAVINVLSECEFMLMDLGSVNKTKVGVKVLQPYLPYPLRNGDTVQFGDVFGIFRLFQLPDTQVEINMPETPVCTKVLSRIGQPVNVPESPDVSDKEGSFIASSQPPNLDNLPFKNVLRQRETSREGTATHKSENNLKVAVRDRENDSVFWNASTQSPSINFNLDDSENSFSVSNRSSVASKASPAKVNNSGGKYSLALKCNISAVSPKIRAETPKEEINIHEMETQMQDDKHLTIHEMETQNEFEISCNKQSSSNKTKSATDIHEQATQLDFLDNKAIINQSGTEDKAMEKGNNIFEAETQLFADQDTFILDDNDTTGNVSVHNDSTKVEDKANLTKESSSVVQASESDEEILFNEFESQGFDPFPGLQESQSLIDKETEVEPNDARNGAVSPILSITSPIKTTPFVLKDRVCESETNSRQEQANVQDSVLSTDSEDDVVVRKKSKRINVLVESDDDSTDCEEEIEVIVNDAKILPPVEKLQKLVQPKINSLIARDLIKENNVLENFNIADALTQILPVDVMQSPVKINTLVGSVTENLSDALTQVLPAEKHSDATLEDDFTNTTIKQITPYNLAKPPTKVTSGEKQKKCIKTASINESGNTHDFKKPLLSTPLKLKRPAGLTNKEPSPNCSLMKGFTPFKSSPSKRTNDANKFYDDTQDLLDDLLSQKENCEANIDDPKPVDISEEVTQKLYSEPQSSSIRKDPPYYDTTQNVLADMLTQQLPEGACNAIPETGTEVESQDADLMQLTRCVTPQGLVRENLRNTRKMLEKVNQNTSCDDDMVPSSQDDDDDDVDRFPHITKNLPDAVLDTSTSSSDGVATANNYVNSLTTQQVREVVGDFEGVDSAKNGFVPKKLVRTPVKRRYFDSDTSDLETTPRKKRSLFDIELPNSEEIRTAVELKKPNRTVLESASDSDSGAEDEARPFTPIVHRRKVPSKRKTETKASDLTEIVGLAKRVITRIRKPTEKLRNNIELNEIRSPRENEKREVISADIIAENIAKLKSAKNKRDAKANKPIEKDKIDKRGSKPFKDDNKESNHENKSRNIRTSNEHKLTNVKSVKERESDVSRGTNAKNTEEEHVETVEPTVASNETKTRSKRPTRHKKDKERSSKIVNDETARDDKDMKEDSQTDKRKIRHQSRKTQSKEIKESSSSEHIIDLTKVQKPNIQNKVTVPKSDISKTRNGGDLRENEKKAVTSNDKRKNRNAGKESTDGNANTPREIKLKSILVTSSRDSKIKNPDKDTGSDEPKIRHSTRIRNSAIAKPESTSSQPEDLIETNKPRVNPKKREPRGSKKNIDKREPTDLVVGSQSMILESTVLKNAGKSPQQGRKRLAEDSASTVITPKRARSGNLEMSPSIARTGTPSRLSLRQKHSVLVTAFSNEKMITAVKKLGASIVTDALSCTVVVTERVKRTFKLLCAVGLGKPIVGQTWLQACVVAGTLVDPWLYILEDGETESRYKFKLNATLAGRRNFLHGYSISATPSVLPAATEMKQIVECSGGRWGESRSSSGRWFCVTCAADHVLWPALRQRGAVLVTSELVLGGVLTQQLNLKGCKIPDV